jgi:hypothetical protein
MFRRFVLSLFILAAGAVAAHADDAFKSLAQGVEYRHEVRAAGPLSIHVLRIDRRQKWDLETGLGQGTVYGLEPLPGIVARVASLLKKPAVAAINGDFFVIKPGPYQGDPRGLQIAQGELVSRPMGTSFWVMPSGEFKIGPVESKLRVIWPDSRVEMPLGLNEARADDEATLYTPTLGLRLHEMPKEPLTTRTKGGKELVLERIEGQAWLPVQTGKTYSARVVDVRDGGNSPLQANKMILSIGPKLTFPAAKLGSVLQLVMETKPNLAGVKTALGAGRMLVAGGKLPDLGPANQPRHPRSMIGWNDNYLYFIVVDGRQKFSIGITYPEMAALVKEYGCVEAAELDGGGSSTIWAMGKVLNSPSDGRPRAIANGLILFRGNAGDATP